MKKEETATLTLMSINVYSVDTDYICHLFLSVLIEDIVLVITTTLLGLVIKFMVKIRI